MGVRNRSFAIIFVCGVCLSAPSEADGQARQFRAGAAATNVNPWLELSINGGMQDRKVAHIHDDLHARALVLDDGQARIAIVVVDSCMIPREIFDRAKSLAQQHTGIPVENMLMSATHTHSAPAATGVFQSEPDADYGRFLTVRIADAVRQAMSNLHPAQIGWSAGRLAEEVFNRRWRMKPGTIPPNPFGEIDRVRMNPPAGSPDLLEPAGPIDPDIFVVCVRKPDGTPIALLANYSLHYVGGTGPGHVSADYFGMFAERISEVLGADDPDGSDPPFVALMSNGTSGNINNVDFRRQRERKPAYVQMRHVANRVAAEVERVVNQMDFRAWVPLRAREAELELGVRRPSPRELDRARRILMRAEGPNMKSREEIYARETLFLSDYPASVPMIVQVLRMGGLAVAAIPCEVFVEIGLELKEKSPSEGTFTISLANGYNGYLPTAQHHELGGYETWRARSSYLEKDAAEKIIRRLLSLMTELWEPN